MSDVFSPDDVHPHVSTHTCGRCRKEFQKGHRVITAYIYCSRGANPLNLGNSGAILFEEFELVHADCHDPFLKKGLRDA